MIAPSHLAMLHRAAFTQDRAWSEDEFANLLATPHCHVLADPNGFALIRVIADEAELLTIAVHPDHRRTGLGKSLLTQSMSKAADQGAFELFLEVAADNKAALALYQSTGFAQVGLRPGYYAREERAPVDALLLSRPCRKVFCITASNKSKKQLTLGRHCGLIWRCKTTLENK